MVRAVLITGGNAGDAASTLADVRREIERRAGRICSLSSVRRSAAWGFEAADFYNQVLEIETPQDAETLLDTLQDIERRAGRNREAEAEEKRARGSRYASRTADIDILFYGDEVVRSERLTIPHPLMGERRFVLEPLAEVCPERVHPVEGCTVAQMLARLNERESERESDKD